MFRKAFVLIFSLFLVSCGVKNLPERVVPLNKNQLNRLNGYYEVEAYQSTHSLYPKPLNDILNVDLPRKISYVKFEFLTEKKLLVSYDLDGVVQQEVIKGKAKHGGFYIHKRWGAFGIPLLFWTQWNEGQRLFMGNDDNLIFDNFEDGHLMIFGLQTVKANRQTYYYDRLYPSIYNGKPKNDLTN